MTRRGATRRVFSALSIALVIAACGVLRVAAEQGAADARPRLVSHVLPVYPRPAINAHLQGVVVVVGRVGTAGTLQDLRIQRSVPLLNEAVTEALAQWRFEPPSEGTPVVEIWFDFVLGVRSAHPSTFSPPLPSWVPANFAFQYTVQCATGAVALDSVTRRVRFPVESGRNEAPFAFESQSAVDLLPALVQAGFYTAEVSAFAEETTAPLEIRQESSRMVVTVAAAEPPARLAVIDGRGRSASHELAVRGGRNWRTVRWTEPLSGSTSGEIRAIAAVARRLAEAVLMRVEGQEIQPRDVCL